METYVFKIFVQSNELITETFSNQKAHWKNISDAYFLCWETFFFFTKIYVDYLIKVFKFGEIILFLCIVTSFYHISSIYIYIYIWITLQWKNPILEKEKKNSISAVLHHNFPIQLPGVLYESSWSDPCGML